MGGRGGGAGQLECVSATILKTRWGDGAETQAALMRHLK